MILYIPVILTFVFAQHACISRADYLNFDSSVPDSIPRLFADEIFRLDSSYIGYGSFNPVDQDFYYAITDQSWSSSKIVRLNASHKIDSLGFNINEDWEGEPMFTPGGERLYFTAVVRDKDLHSDLFYVEKTGNTWSEAKAFELNSPACEWHISFTEKKTAYFGSEREGSRLKADIFYAECTDGVYTKAIKLPSSINTEYNDCDPLIAPDESYLFFHSDRPGGYGDHDLYISYNQGENGWTEPINLGKHINTAGWEMGPSLSSDGEYLFFTRRKSWDTKEPSRIYWVSMKSIIKKTPFEE